VPPRSHSAAPIPGMSWVSGIMARRQGLVPPVVAPAPPAQPTALSPTSHGRGGRVVDGPGAPSGAAGAGAGAGGARQQGGRGGGASGRGSGSIGSGAGAPAGPPPTRRGGAGAGPKGHPTPTPTPAPVGPPGRSGARSKSAGPATRPLDRLVQLYEGLAPRAPGATSLARRLKGNDAALALMQAQNLRLKVGRALASLPPPPPCVVSCMCPGPMPLTVPSCGHHGCPWWWRWWW
jgi:hypothetical protein